LYAPQTYLVALVLMLTSMVCWGSWVGFLVTSALYGVTLGPGDGLEFFGVLSAAAAREAAFAVVGGFIWNIGNILLLTAIVIAGLAVAFPIAAIPAIVLGLGASYWLQAVGNGLVLTVSAACADTSTGLSRGMCWGCWPAQSGAAEPSSTSSPQAWSGWR
jgi:glucose uptake protein